MKSEIIYFDENDNIVEKENAVRAVIRELDSNGNLVREVFGVIDNSIPLDVSDEEFDALSK